MEVSSRKSEAGKPTSQYGSGSPLPGSQPLSVALPLAFVLVGLAALLTGVVWLVVRPAILAQYHYNQYVIAATHLFVLGWICSVVMGAMYQLVPVALETRLYSCTMAWWQLVLHILGFVGMVWMFRVWNMKQVGHFGCLLGIGVGLFVYNLGRTLGRVPRWNVTATAVTAALGWISLTVAAGICITIGKCAYESTEGMAVEEGVRTLLNGLRSAAGFMLRFDVIGAMHAHAHLGGIGVFMMMIVGVSYKLIPMFTLSEIRNPRRAVWSVALLNFGLAGSFVTILLRSSWKPAFALVVVVALAIYGGELIAILRSRKRRALDWGIRYFLTAIGLMLPLSVLAVVLSWPTLPVNLLTSQLENVYGFLGLVGVVSFAIIGMLYKIIPFLVWFGCYRRQIGHVQVPALADLYSARLQAAGYWSYLAGLGITCAAILFRHEPGVRWGCVLLASSVLTLAINVGLMLSHYFKPHLKPFSFLPSTIQEPA